MTYLYVVALLGLCAFRKIPLMVVVTVALVVTVLRLANALP